MDSDYYTILNIPEDSTPDIITQAYKLYATKSHPRNQSEEIEHLTGLNKTRIWELINEAYDVLSNPQTRDIFDRYGEEGLKSGTPHRQPYMYHGEPMKTYNDALTSWRPKIKDANLEITLPLDIKEVYNGTVKAVQMLRRNYNPNGNNYVLQEHRVIIPVQPGVSSGTRYLFREEGDQGPATIPADVIFKVKDMENDVYRRDGSDIHMNYPVSLIDALCGFTQPLSIRTLDDRQFNITITDVVGPNYVKRIQNEGLPLEHDNNMKGDLYIHFGIKFPTQIPMQTKNELRKILEQLPE